MLSTSLLPKRYTAIIIHCDNHVMTPYFVIRSRVALRTTRPGVRPCTACLVQSGPKSMGVQCGQLKLFHKKGIPVNQ